MQRMKSELDSHEPSTSVSRFCTRKVTEKHNFHVDWVGRGMSKLATEP